MLKQKSPTHLSVAGAILFSLFSLAACGDGPATPIKPVQQTSAAQTAVARDTQNVGAIETVVNAGGAIVPSAVAAATQSAGAIATVVSAGQTAAPPISAAATESAAIAGTAVSAGQTALPTVIAAATQNASALATTAGQVTVIPQEVAQKVITTYATEILGTKVETKWAGGVSSDVAQLFSLSPKVKEAQVKASQLAVVSYGALLTNGAATVSYGSGAIAGDVTVDIKAASFGAFSLTLDQSPPTTEADALALAKLIFPTLADRAYVTTENTPRGFAWKFSGQVPSVDIKTLQATVVAESITLGVSPNGRSRTVLYVAVGRGDFATTIKP